MLTRTLTWPTAELLGANGEFFAYFVDFTSYPLILWCLVCQGYLYKVLDSTNYMFVIFRTLDRKNEKEME